MTPLAGERLLAIIDTQNEITATALDVEAVMALVVRRALELTGAAGAVVEMVDGEEMVYRAAAGCAEAHTGLRLRADSSLSGLCVARDEVLYSRDTSKDHRVDEEACLRVGATSMVCVPLRHAGAVVGVLKVYDSCVGTFEVEDLETLALLSGVVTAHMARSGDYQEQRNGSHHDPLTGMASMLAFEQRLAAETSRIRRHGDQVTLCLLDLDRFKRVNDKLGHAAGDQVLRAVARRIDTVRGEDSAFRIGGDEFALILVGADEEGAWLLAERIAADVLSDPECRGVGVSSGITTLTGDPTADVERADAALYASKRSRPS